MRWASVPGKYYFLERGTNLASSVSFAPLMRNLPGQEGSTAYTDSNAAAGGAQRYFYRVGVE